jgi:tryptophan synthase beta chain
LLAIAVAKAGHGLVIKLAPKQPKDQLIVMNMCGRGDKDIFTVAAHLGVKL